MHLFAVGKETMSGVSWLTWINPWSADFEDLSQIYISPTLFSPNVPLAFPIFRKEPKPHKNEMISQKRLTHNGAQQHLH